MEPILQEVERAISADLYYVAIAVCLTLPDVCAELAAPANARSDGVRARYTAWCKANLMHKLKPMDAEDLYNLRCGVVHHGRGRHSGMRREFSRVIFTFPAASERVGNLVMHRHLSDDALFLDAPTFCRDVMACVRAWYEKSAEHRNVKANSDLLLRPRPEGVAPYIVGHPVIA